MSVTPGLRVFGFPLDVRPGFLILLALFGFLYPDEGLGIWLAGAVGVFTLIHELGHAFAARATGAKAEITLDFLAGYASFVPTRPLKRRERAGIALAGPGIQIVLGATILLLMQDNPLSEHNLSDPPSTLAIWFAGPVMGLINLFPILPLDGGNIVMSGLDAIIPGRSKLVMIYASMALTIITLIYLFNHGTVVSPYFLIFPLLTQIQMLRESNERQQVASHGDVNTWAMSAEQQSWSTGKPGKYPPGFIASPWFRAAQLLRSGKPEQAGALLSDDLTHGSAHPWVPPYGASARELSELVATLPRPFPSGNAASESMFADLLIQLGEYTDAGHVAAAVYQRTRTAVPAALVAQCAAALGNPSLAIDWLRSAANSSDTNGLASILQRAEFNTIRHSPEVVGITQRL